MLDVESPDSVTDRTRVALQFALNSPVDHRSTRLVADADEYNAVRESQLCRVRFEDLLCLKMTVYRV
jgi:hypothetical protein